MTPEKAEALLRATLLSIRVWSEEVELIEAHHPGAAVHLLAALKQAEQSLGDLLKRD